MKRRSLTGALLGILVTGTIAVGSPAQAETQYAVTGGVITYDSPGVASSEVTVTCTSDTDQSVDVSAQLAQSSDLSGAYLLSDTYTQVPCGVDPTMTTVTLIFQPMDSFVAGPATMTVWLGANTSWVDLQTTVPEPEVAPTPPPPPVTSPSSPRSLHTTKNTHRATLYWSAPASNGGASITGYQVQRGTATSTRHSVSASTRLALFTGLTNGHRYQLWVRAKNTVGYSKWVSAYATPQAPPAPRAYKNCTAMNSGMWPHGVGRSGARDKTSGTPVTTFKVSTTGYQMNDGRVVSKGQYDLDRDNDGIACEKR